MSSLSEEQMQWLVLQHGEEFASSIDCADESAVPDEWSRVARQCNVSNLSKLTSQFADSLPRLASYITSRCDGAAVAKDKTGPVLVLSFPDWESKMFDKWRGFLVAGLPCTPDEIAHLESRVGPVPSSLHSLWRSFGHMTTKDHGGLCAPIERVPLAGEHVEAIGTYTVHGGTERFECLKIGFVSYDLATCLTRRPGELLWGNPVVRVLSTGNWISPAPQNTLEDWLVNWEYTDFNG